MSKSFSRMTSKLDGGDKEYAWGCVLSKEAEEYDWDHEEEEDDDEDYCQHTLMPRTAVLGKTAKEGERNIVEVVTKDYNGKELVCPILSLTLGRTDMVCFDLSFSGMAPVKFRLAEGSGPVHMTGIDLVQYPEDPAGAMLEYTDAEEYEDEDDMEATETEGDEEASTKKGAKRKGGKQGGKGKKGRMDSSAISTGEDEVDDNESEESDEEEEDMEDDVDSDEEEDDESEEIESSPEKPKSKKKGSKESKGKAQTKVKKSSKSPAKAKKEKSKPQKKAGKKSKK